MTAPAILGQAQAVDMNLTSETVIARYLAAGGAHVTVTREVESRRNDPVLRDVDRCRYVANCDACGYVNSAYYSDEPDPDALRYTERAANAHAASCRRIPEHLWLKDGAS